MSSQSGWSDLDGSHIDKIKSTTGKDVRPTIKHAKMHGLIPRVSGIVHQLDNHQILEYSNLQVAEATIRTYGAYINEVPEGDEEAWTKFYKEVIKPAADEHRNETADKGSAIHAEIERWLLAMTESLDSYEAFSNYTPSGPALEATKTLFNFFKENKVVDVVPEATFGGGSIGFSGSPDIIAISPERIFVIDTKTTTLSKFKGPYEAWKVQLGGYSKHPMIHDEDLGLPATFIQAVFDADTGEAWSVKRSNKNGEMLDGLFEYSPCIMQRAIRQFELQYELWTIRNGYDPRKFWAGQEAQSVFDKSPEIRA